jgi:hypothetical protein
MDTDAFQPTDVITVQPTAQGNMQAKFAQEIPLGEQSGYGKE